MKIRTNRWVFEISPNGEGTGFVVEKLGDAQGAISDFTTNRRFGKTLSIDMKEGTLILDESFFILGIISIES